MADRERDELLRCRDELLLAVDRARDPRCKTCGGKGNVIEEITLGGAALVYSDPASCPSCGGSGRIGGQA